MLYKSQQNNIWEKNKKWKCSYSSVNQDHLKTLAYENKKITVWCRIKGTFVTVLNMLITFPFIIGLIFSRFAGFFSSLWTTLTVRKACPKMMQCTKNKPCHHNQCCKADVCHFHIHMQRRDYQPIPIASQLSQVAYSVTVTKSSNENTNIKVVKKKSKE